MNNNLRQDYNCHDGKYNMHIWLSPVIARRVAEVIYDRLVDFFPEKKQQLDDNLRIFNDSLTKNDKMIDTMLSAVRSKEYFVYHNAYGYFEKYYGLKPSGHFVINSEIHPGARALYRIKARLDKRKSICVFSEPQFKSAFIKVVAGRTSSVHIGILDPLGTGIALDKESYMLFLSKLSSQYVSCLERDV